jgi:dihydropteroate synthase
MKLTPPKLVGILNVTPDSFSDGGLCGDNAAIMQAARNLIKDGASIIDIGAESTRPGAVPLTFDEEWARLDVVLPQICNLAKENCVLTSIDTRHVKTARKAIECGIDWINDVSGAADVEMLEILRGWQGRVVIMHNLGIPADKNITINHNVNPVDEVMGWLSARIELLEKSGINQERIIIDPGIGFGKTAQQSWQLIENITELQSLGAEILVGHSRKSFLSYPFKNFGIKKTFNSESEIQDKDEATLEVSLKLAESGVNYLRVHNVALHNAALMHP